MRVRESAAQGRLFLADAHQWQKERERLNIPVGVRLWPLFVTVPVTIWISSFGSRL
jgi:hypothetical protein